MTLNGYTYNINSTVTIGDWFGYSLNTLKFKLDEFYYFESVLNTALGTRDEVKFVYVKDGLVQKIYTLKDVQRIVKLSEI
jgi:hypothetical protein